MTLIGRKRFDNQIFVQCDCGEEIIEFCRTYDEEEGTEYFIHYHGYFNLKKDNYCGFYFADKGKFSAFLQEMRDCLNDIPKDDATISFDKYLTYKNKLPGVLISTYDDKGFFSILKYNNPKEAIKAKKCTWEVILRKEQVEELLKELEEWR